MALKIMGFSGVLTPPSHKYHFLLYFRSNSHLTVDTEDTVPAGNNTIEIPHQEPVLLAEEVPSMVLGANSAQSATNKAFQIIADLRSEIYR